MRFDLLAASISPGLYAPLALMVGGFLLAVIGLAFLLLRRRKKAGRPMSRQGSVEPAAALENTEEAAPIDAKPAPLGRRRSLVSGAERDELTPSDEIADNAATSNGDEAEQAIEDAEFDELEEAEESAETGVEEEYAHEQHAGEDGGEDGGEDAEEQDWDNPDVELEEPAQLREAAVAAAIAEQAKADDEDEALISPEVEAARKTPIVFRQFLPQSPGKDGLSFYGGQPIGPDNFQWPRERGSQGGAPLQFLMQWDCTQLTEQDPTGLLPQEGVLYFFVNCDRDLEEDFLSSHTFVHHRGSVKAWGPIDIPEDAGPALGKTAALTLSGCTPAVPNADDYVPRVMPRFPFEPIAFHYPAENRDEGKVWSADTAAAALLDIQKSGLAAPAARHELEHSQDEINRPFASFPHDFGAIRVIASRMIEALQDPDPLMAEALFTELSPEQREAQFDDWSEQAKELYLLGTQRPEGQKLEPNISDDIWNWFEPRKGILGTDLGALVVETVDLSLSVSSEALGDVPADWIDKAMDAHALAREYTNGEGVRIHAPVPARMFGPSSPVAGIDAELVDEHILLLELPSGSGPQHDFGGKVLQYWITPDDLAAGKFDEVKSRVFDA